MTSAIGSLRVLLGLDSANFEAGTKRARNEASRTAKSIQGSFGGIKNMLGGFVAGIGVSGILAAASAGLEYASSLGEVAQQLGVTTTDLQTYRAVAGEVGISQEEMDKGLQKLTVTIGKAANGSKQQVETFRELGIAVVDVNGRVRTAGEVIPKLADALAKIKDPATRARIEVELFGKTGQKLDTLLSGGSAAINDLAEAYRKFGAILTPQQIKNADEAADTLQRLKTIMSGRIAGWAADAAPGIVRLINLLTQLGQLPDKYPLLRRLLSAGQMATNPLGVASSLGLNRLTASNSPVAQFKSALAEMKKAEAELDRVTTSNSMTPKGLSTARTNYKAAIADFRRANNELRASVGSGSGAEISAPDGALPTVASEAGKASKKVKELKTDLDFVKEGMEDFWGNVSSLKSSNSSIFDDLTKPAAEPDDALSRARDAIDKQKEVALDAADEVTQHKHEQEANSIQQLAGLYQSLFTGGTKSFLGTLKNLGLQVISELAAKWTASLFSGGGGGGGFLGSILGGLGSIFGGGGGFGTGFGGAFGTGWTPKKFATGGSFRVGGSGPIDSKLFNLALSPGEMVDVRKPGNDNGGRSGGMKVEVVPSPYFDVRVTEISRPIANEARRGATGDTLDVIGRSFGRAVPTLARRR